MTANCIGDLYKVDSKNLNFRVKKLKNKDKINDVK